MLYLGRNPVVPVVNINGSAIYFKNGDTEKVILQDNILFDSDPQQQITSVRTHLMAGAIDVKGLKSFNSGIKITSSNKNLDDMASATDENAIRKTLGCEIAYNSADGCLEFIFQGQTETSQTE